MNLSEDLDLEDFIARPEKISAADISAICQEAGMQAVRRNRYVILHKDFEAGWKEHAKKKDKDFDFYSMEGLPDSQTQAQTELRTPATMVVKTDPCAYTEYKIYPGRGQKFVAKDGKITFFISAKADSLWHQKIKAVKLTWSQAWRRMNKKGALDKSGKRKLKKKTNVTKAIVGLSLEDMQAKRARQGELRKKADEAKAKEMKARQAKKTDKKPHVKATNPTTTGKSTKNQKAGPAKNFNQRK